MAEVGTSPGSAPAGPAPAAAGARKLVIVGFMCAGKSRLGRLAAQRLGWPLADSDKLLEERFGEPIASFFAREGEQAFRDREQELVLELLAAPGPAVVPLGGGAVESRPVRDALADHDVVLVEVDAEVAWERARKSDRPLAHDREHFAQLHAAGARCTNRWPAWCWPTARRRRRRSWTRCVAAAAGRAWCGRRRATPCGWAPVCWMRQRDLLPDEGASS